MFREFGHDVDSILVGIVTLAIVAAIVSTQAAPALITDTGKALKSLIGVILSPVSK